MPYSHCKLCILISVVLLFELNPAAAQNLAATKDKIVSERKDSISAAMLDTLRKIPNIAFTGGEVLRFDVNYGFVTAGEAILKVIDTVFHNRKCYLIEFSLNAKPFFDAFYKVRDRYYTLIDAAGIFPWRFEQHVREGSYSKDFTAEFDQINHRAVTTGGNYGIPSYVQDMMSAFYYSRTLDYSKFRPGDRIHLRNFYKDSTYSFDVKYKGIQTIEVEAGKFNCIVIEPLAKEGGLFKSEGSVIIWLTNDERKMPVLVSAKILIGKVKSELTGYNGVAGPLNSKIP